jgi:hypothetical protein
MYTCPFAVTHTHKNVHIHNIMFMYMQSRAPDICIQLRSTHTHTHTHTYIYIIGTHIRSPGLLLRWDLETWFVRQILLRTYGTSSAGHRTMWSRWEMFCVRIHVHAPYVLAKSLFAYVNRLHTAYIHLCVHYFIDFNNHLPMQKQYSHHTQPRYT